MSKYKGGVAAGLSARLSYQAWAGKFPTHTLYVGQLALRLSRWSSIQNLDINMAELIYHQVRYSDEDQVLQIVKVLLNREKAQLQYHHGRGELLLTGIRDTKKQVNWRYSSASLPQTFWKETQRSPTRGHSLPRKEDQPQMVIWWFYPLKLHQ